MNTVGQQERTAVAYEILRQIGGSNKLSALVGAHTFVHGTEDNGDVFLSFKLKASPRFNFIKIILNWDDLYTVEFAKIPSGLRSLEYRYKPDASFSRIDCDSLKSLLEEECRCYFSLAK